MSEDPAEQTDARSRARIVRGLDKMVASGRMTAQEADRIRAAANPGEFDEAVRAVRVRHAGSRLAEAVDDGRMTANEAEGLLERLKNGDHSGSLRARLRSHTARPHPPSRPAPISEDLGAGDTPGVVAPPPLIYVAGLLLGTMLGVVIPPPALPRAAAWPRGGVMVLAGLALGISFVAAFRRARTPVDARGRTTTIVTTGPYRISRNPAYLSMALVYTGIALATGATWALLTLIPTLILIDRGVVIREERYLERNFGEQYTRFKTRTRRWL